MSDHQIKYRPIKGGISVISTALGDAAGTLGVLIRDCVDNSIVAITNCHCVGLLYNPNFKTPTDGYLSVDDFGVRQPGTLDGGTSDDVFGIVKRAVTLQFGTDSIQQNFVDGAIITLNQEIEGDGSILDAEDGPYKFASSFEYIVGTDVFKSGRTTGYTPTIGTAKISSKYASVNVSYGSGDENTVHFINQIAIISTNAFLQGGDSGSALLCDVGGETRIVGLAFAANDAGTLCFANHIADVAYFLDVEAWEGDTDIIGQQLTYDTLKEWGINEEETLNQSLYFGQKVTISKVTVRFESTVIDPINNIKIKCAIRKAIGTDLVPLLDLEEDITGESIWHDDDDILPPGEFTFDIPPILRLPGVYWFTISLNGKTAYGIITSIKEGGLFNNRFIFIKNGSGEYLSTTNLMIKVVGTLEPGNDEINDIELDQYMTLTIRDEAS